MTILEAYSKGDDSMCIELIPGSNTTIVKGYQIRGLFISQINYYNANLNKRTFYRKDWKFWGQG